MKGLTDGDECYIRILACNAGGVSEPAEIDKPIIVKDQTGPPEFLVNEEVCEFLLFLYRVMVTFSFCIQLLRDGLTVKRGNMIKLLVNYKGRPPPQVTWSKAGLDLAIRAMIAIHGDSTELVIRDVDRRDAGDYKVRLVNKCGDAEVSWMLNSYGLV